MTSVESCLRDWARCSGRGGRETVWLQEARKNSLMFKENASMPTFSRSTANLSFHSAMMAWVLAETKLRKYCTVLDESECN